MPRFPQHEAEKGERQEHQPRGREQYSIRLWTKALYVVRSTFFSLQGAILCFRMGQTDSKSLLLERDGGARAGFRSW